MHAHFEQVEWGPIYLAAGATTVRDCGNEFEFITAVRDAVAAGADWGRGSNWRGSWMAPAKLALGVERVDTPEQAKMWVDKYHDAGFQQMKIYSSVKLEELKDVADEAHRLGMTVTGHVPEGLNAYQAIEAGQDQINHVPYIADIMHAAACRENASRREQAEAAAHIDLNSPEAQKAIAFLVQHHTVVDPTLAIFEFLTANTRTSREVSSRASLRVAPELQRAARRTWGRRRRTRTSAKIKLFEKELQIVGALHKAGVPIVAGTDQTVPGYSLYREIELYVQAGFTPMEAIQAATIVPARVMGLDKELGTVEAGKRADLIIVGANPLESHSQHSQSANSVVTGGMMYNCAELWKQRGIQARNYAAGRRRRLVKDSSTRGRRKRWASSSPLVRCVDVRGISSHARTCTRRTRTAMENWTRRKFFLSTLAGASRLVAGDFLARRPHVARRQRLRSQSRCASADYFVRERLRSISMAAWRS